MTAITMDVKTSRDKLKWYHWMGLVKPKCPRCGKAMLWECLVPGYDFAICPECQIIRD